MKKPLVAPSPKKGTSMMGTALNIGLGHLEDAAVLAQLDRPVRGGLTASNPEPDSRKNSPRQGRAFVADAELPLDSLQPNPDQARTFFDLDSLRELSLNIKQVGVLQPILVRPTSGSNFQILAGERRWRAAKLAGLETIPVYIREFSDELAMEISLIENLHRADLNRIEKLEKVLTLLGSHLNQARDWVIAALRQAWAEKQNRKPLKVVANPDQLERLLAYLKGLGVGFSNLVVTGLPCLSWPKTIYRAVLEGTLGIRQAELILQAPENLHRQLMQRAKSETLEEFETTFRDLTAPKTTPVSREPDWVKSIKAHYAGGLRVSAKGNRTSITLTANNDEELKALKKLLTRK